jgi:hypothetical protein
MSDSPKIEFKPKKSVALSGVTAGTTALCSVGKSGNDLHYRGYDILDLAANCEFEEVAFLLIHGKLPIKSELTAYKAKLKSLRGLPTTVKKVLEALPKTAHPMDVMRTGVSALGCDAPESLVHTPEEAKEMIESQSKDIGEPKNLEEQAIKLVGKDVYEKLIKGYTEKQWRKPCSELPKEIIKRLPVRFTFNNNYFNDKYQGIPIGGYTQIFEKLLEGVDIMLNTDYFKDTLPEHDKVIYTGPVDMFFNYKYLNAM